MRRLILSLALVSSLAALTGCGQKGPLFYPPPTASTTASPQPGTQPATSATSLAPPPASSARTPFNPIIHE
ncbi:Predicted small lipoprotein YifL [Luteibacter sp. UNCMF331Sha3.1]|uniref:LPS translocon maturation chaperone LptM n=1 Tax=Luteibacter sp. UNCMF331Sha3.1 TaxID=1502760 RepID=UPI000492875A|nr:lipoprotein [Luteibacter sp. UNCMF331Sha3.1]SEM55842.1 Predicted small lipoprotein YifL [Luteibacter sp. UNCMF331Sha3.1]